MTDKQRNLFWAVAAIAAAIYFGPSFLRQAVTGQPGAYSVMPKTPGPGIKVLGRWRGRTVVPSKGTCLLKLQVDPVPTGFTAYSTFQCEHLVHQNATFPEIVSPPAAALSGTVDKGTVRLTADKTIGTDSTGCVAGPFILTPFSNGQVAVEWTQGPCQGAHILVHRGS